MLSKREWVELGLQAFFPHTLLEHTIFIISNSSSIAIIK